MISIVVLKESGEGMKPSGIGGQAVIEGVMMKNKDEYAIAVRKPDNEIVIDKQIYRGLASRNSFTKLPIIRGVLSFIDSMIIGTRTITYSASFYDEEEETATKHSDKAKANKESKKSKEKKDSKENKEKSDGLFMALTISASVILAVGIFILLPLWLSSLLSKTIESNTLLAVLEGVIRIAIFVIYIFVISRLNDIQRVFMYHGAEHKSINCIENGYELTVENVKWQSRFHKRCGTSFMLIVICISSIFFILIRFDSIILKTLTRLVLVPVIAGISYEFIKLAGRTENKFVEFLSKPGMWMQGLTTKEPTDDMIEVAIASVQAVFDWREFIEEKRVEELPKESRIKEADELIAKAIEESAATKVTEDGFVEPEEDDEILKALDKYFETKHR